MRHVTVMFALLALLALTACGGGGGEEETQMSAEQVAAQHAAAGDCDPAGCAKAAAGDCKSAPGMHGASAQTASTDMPAPEGKVFGEGVSSSETMLVSKLLAEPQKHLGHTVRVQGPVVGVCKHRGCWIEIASDQEKQKIQLKVDDGVIVFPPEIMGETAIVEGVVEGIPMTHEQACAYLEQEANCNGDQFDASEVPAEGITFYRIKGTGAVVLAAAES
jgi:hypothetical protein